MSEFEEELLQAADEILLLIREQSLTNHFIFGTGRPVALKVTDRTGRLAQAVTRATTRGEKANVTLTQSGMEIVGGISKSDGYPHALLIHEGGTRNVTPSMRRFFWAMWYQTRTATGSGSAENQMWSRMRFSNILVYEPRPYLIAAVQEIASQVPEILRQHAFTGLSIEIEKIIAGVRSSI